MSFFCITKLSKRRGCLYLGVTSRHRWILISLSHLSLKIQIKPPSVSLPLKQMSGSKASKMSTLFGVVVVWLLISCVPRGVQFRRASGRLWRPTPGRASGSSPWPTASWSPSSPGTGCRTSTGQTNQHSPGIPTNT